MTSHGTQASIWDGANRLKSMGGHSYAYDGLNNRISQDNGTNVTKYLLDIQPQLALVLRESDGTNTNHYVHSPRGVHAQYDGSDWNHYLNDALGSVRGIVDSSLAMQQAVSYNQYGVPDASMTGFAFTGEQRDGSGVQYHRARYYDPAMGVWLSLDPWEGIRERTMSLNGYSWVEGNTPNMVDPSGHCAIPVGACVTSVLNVFDNAIGIGFGVDFVVCSWATACVGGGLALYYTVYDTFGAEVADALAKALSIDAGTTTVPGNAQPPDVGDVIDDIADEVRRRLADICNGGWCETGLNWFFRYIKGDTIERILRGIRDLIRDRARTNNCPVTIEQIFLTPAILGAFTPSQVECAFDERWDRIITGRTSSGQGFRLSTNEGVLIRWSDNSGVGRHFFLQGVALPYWVIAGPNFTPSKTWIGSGGIAAIKDGTNVNKPGRENPLYESGQIENGRLWYTSVGVPPNVYPLIFDPPIP